MNQNRDGEWKDATLYYVPYHDDDPFHVSSGSPSRSITRIRSGIVNISYLI